MFEHCRLFYKSCINFFKFINFNTSTGDHRHMRLSISYYTMSFSNISYLYIFYFFTRNIRFECLFSFGFDYKLDIGFSIQGRSCGVFEYDNQDGKSVSNYIYFWRVLKKKNLTIRRTIKRIQQ